MIGNSSSGRKRISKSSKDLETSILQEKARVTPDIKIGNKYGVTFMLVKR